MKLILRKFFSSHLDIILDFRYKNLNRGLWLNLEEDSIRGLNFIANYVTPNFGTNKIFTKES